MASPAFIAALRHHVRQGWPLLVAALLTLWLGWSALDEGRGIHSEARLHASAAAPDLHSSKDPGGSPPHDPLAPRLESTPDGGPGDGPPLLRRLCLQIPASGPQSAPLGLRSATPVHQPGRRQPPSHAPPALLS